MSEHMLFEQLQQQQQQIYEIRKDIDDLFIMVSYLRSVVNHDKNI